MEIKCILNKVMEVMSTFLTWLTYLTIFGAFLFALYYVFVMFDLSRAIAGLLLAVVSVFVNKSL